MIVVYIFFFFFSSRRRHTRSKRDWSSDVCYSDLVQFMIAGPDLKNLADYSAKLLEKMKAIPDAVDVDSTLISGKPEVELQVDRETAADLGVRVGDVSQALNTLVAGQQATTFNQGADQYA